MSPRNRSFRNVPAPLPLSDQCRKSRDWCFSALYSKSNRHAFELVLHENVALGPKNVAIQTSVKPQSAGHVAFGLNVPPEIVPRRKPWNLPLLPAGTVVPCLPLVSQAPGLWPAAVTNVPRSRRIRRKVPSWFFFTKNRRFSVSAAHTLPQEPWSSMTTL